MQNHLGPWPPESSPTLRRAIVHQQNYLCGMVRSIYTDEVGVTSESGMNPEAFIKGFPLEGDGCPLPYPENLCESC